MKRLFLCLLVAFGLCLSATLPARAADIQKISFEQLSDIVSKTGDKLVLLNIFASWCPPCRDEIPDLKKLRQRYPEKKLILIGISVDEDDNALSKFAKRMQFNYPIYQDNGSIAKTLNVTGIPRNIIINGNGDVIYDEVGGVTEADLTEVINTAK